MLGTTKPPVLADRHRVAVATAGHRLPGDRPDRRARRRPQSVIDRLDAEVVRPGLIVFCSTTPTLAFDVSEMVTLKRRYGAPLVCFGPHASAAAGRVDGARARRRRHDRGRTRGRGGRHRPARIAGRRLRDPRRGAAPQRHGVAPRRTRACSRGSSTCRRRRGTCCRSKRYRLPLVNEPYVLIETSRGCPYTLRLLRGPAPPRPQVPRAFREDARRRDRAGQARPRHPVLLPLGRHGHAQREDVQPVLRRADRAEPRTSGGSRTPAPTTSSTWSSSSGSRGPGAGCSRWASSRSRTPCART